jgi:3-oxoacyl-[acyl-carrier protein] reductase
MSSRLDGRVAVVTGAGRGFGRSIAELLAERGAAVGVLDLDASAAEQVAGGIESRGARACALPADVSVDESVEAAFARAGEALGPVDVLVNNAGIASFASVETLDRDEWDRVLLVDLTSMFLCTRAVVGGMIELRRGSIVNIASLAGKRGGGILGKCVYATAKAGVLGFTKATARELAPHGIRVNAVAPAAFDTEMTKVFHEDEALLQRVLQTIPLGRLGRPDELAPAVAFLASDEASYITGETINLDGGIQME